MNAQNAMSLTLAAFAAIAVQPLVLPVWLLLAGINTGGPVPLADIVGLSIVVCIFATPFVLFVGLPAGLLLRHHPHRGWWLAAIGFVAAALPVGLLVGVRADKLDDLGSMLVFGLHGLAGALAFHLTWRHFDKTGAAASGLR